MPRSKGTPGLSRAVRVRCGHPRSFIKPTISQFLRLNKSDRRLAEESKSQRDHIAGERVVFYSLMKLITPQK
jgi:hypothetical protein